MATTDKRQLRLTISAILESHGIDDLVLEGQVTDAVTLFFDLTGKGKSPVNARRDILEGMLTYLDKQRQYENMNERIEKSLHVRPDGGDKWNEIVKFLEKREADGETIERYADWCKTDQYNSPKTHQIALKPDIIRATWPSAFLPTAKEIKQSFDPFAALSGYLSQTGDD